MFSRMPITKSTENYSEQIECLKNKLKTSDSIVIGAGAGLSTSAGFTYSGERFQKYFLEIVKDKDYFVITTNVDHCF